MNAIVFGAGGFIGSHMVKRLKEEGYWVLGVDLKYPEFSKTKADDFFIMDLTCIKNMKDAICHKESIDEIYQFAADMGGAGYIFTGNNDADIMQNSASINLNLLKTKTELNKKNNSNNTKIFYSSSACIYPSYNQEDASSPDCRESSAYPAAPDSEYGWEKLFSERLFMSYNRNYKIPIAIARYHNIYGPEGTWNGGKEKAPAAICRKIASLPKEGGEIEVWGDGNQTRSFLYIDECIEATRKLMKSDYKNPINIGSEEMVTINKLVEITTSISKKEIKTKHISNAPLGVRGRNSNNDLIRKTLGWDYSINLKEGIEKTYEWINNQIKISKQTFFP